MPCDLHMKQNVKHNQRQPYSALLCLCITPTAKSSHLQNLTEPLANKWNTCPLFHHMVLSIIYMICNFQSLHGRFHNTINEFYLLVILV